MASVFVIQIIPHASESADGWIVTLQLVTGVVGADFATSAFTRVVGAAAVNVVGVL